MCKRIYSISTSGYDSISLMYEVRYDLRESGSRIGSTLPRADYRDEVRMSGKYSSDIEEVGTNRYLPQKFWIEWISHGDNLYAEFFNEMRDFGSIEFFFRLKHCLYFFILESKALETPVIELIIELFIILLILKDANKSSLSESNRVKENERKKWVHIERDYGSHKWYAKVSFLQIFDKKDDFW